MSKGPILHNFVSEVDRLLESFSKEHPFLSETQQRELNKFLRVARLRDQVATLIADDSKIWDQF